MRTLLLQTSALVITTLLLGAGASAEVKRVAYPRVKVEVAQAYKPDAAFETMRKAFADAVARKDVTALLALVAPSFVWAVNGALTSDFDPGREAQHNFKVLFGFRQLGRDVDGGVEEGPFWSSLATFATEDTFFQTIAGGNLVCSPIGASIVDDGVFEQARGQIETDDEAAEWFFVLRDVPVTRSPDDKGLPIARLGQEAFPVLVAHPPTPEGKPAPTPTHFEVLLPSGRTGWIPAPAALPLDTSRLCYAKTPDGAWKLALYDAAE